MQKNIVSFKDLYFMIISQQDLIFFLISTVLITLFFKCFFVITKFLIENNKYSQRKTKLFLFFAQLSTWLIVSLIIIPNLAIKFGWGSLDQPIMLELLLLFELFLIHMIIFVSRKNWSLINMFYIFIIGLLIIQFIVNIISTNPTNKLAAVKLFHSIVFLFWIFISFNILDYKFNKTKNIIKKYITSPAVHRISSLSYFNNDKKYYVFSLKVCFDLLAIKFYLSVLINYLVKVFKSLITVIKKNSLSLRHLVNIYVIRIYYFVNWLKNRTRFFVNKLLNVYDNLNFATPQVLQI